MERVDFSHRWSVIEPILDQALELDAGEREAFLQQACDGDAELIQEVQQLLEADLKADEVFADESPDFQPSALGTRVGPYQLTESLGRGGMGEVYSARRVDGQFEQQVAIKFVNLGASSRASERFRLECQALARLNHPNIVSLIDGGPLDSGMAFMAMERVDGQSIAAYARERQLDRWSRIRLMLQLCDAVAYAHRNLIVHRDLKPSNVLVSDEGRLKLLDFGISKDLSLDATETAPLMTPRYAAPEQILGQPVTTLTDIYALGLLLFELLTDRAPFSDEDQSLEALVRRARKVQPRAPSTVAGHRHLRGPVDAVILKCLQSEPAARYASVEALQQDLQRLLDREPPLAGSRSAWVRATAFVRRNSLATAAVAVVLVSGSLAGYWHYSRVTEARDQAEAALGFLTSMMTDFDPRSRSQDNSLQITAADFFRIGLENLSAQDQLSDPARATLARIFSAGLEHAGDLEQAVQAAELAVLHSPPGDEDHYWARLRRAAILTNAQQADRAQLDYRFLEDSIGSTVEPDSYLAGTIWNDVGYSLTQTDTERSAVYLNRAVEVLTRLSGPDIPQALSAALDNLARVEETLGLYQQAYDHRNEAIAIRTDQYGPEHLVLAHLYANQANLSSKVQSMDSGGELHLKAITIAERILDSSHNTVLVMRNNYALWLQSSGDLDSAAAELSELIDLREAADTTDTQALAGNYQNLATVLRAQGHLDRANRAAAKCTELYDLYLPPESYQHALPWLTRSEIALSQDRLAQSRDYAMRARSHLNALPTRHPIVTAADLLAATAESRERGCSGNIPTADSVAALADFLRPEHPLQAVVAQSTELVSCPSP